MELFWIGIAFGSGLIAKSVKLPTLIGYLLAGILLSALGITTTELLIEIGDLGVILLLFTLGLHLRLKNMFRPEVLGVGGGHLLLTVLLFGAVLLAFRLTFTSALLVAVALSFSSTVLTAKMLEARDELNAYHGRVAIGILIVQDVVAIGLLALTGTETPTLWAFALLALPLLRPFLQRVMAWSGQDELILLFGLLMAIGGGFLFEQVGVSDKLGALIAGILLAGQPRSDDLYQKLWGLKEVFLVGFFLQVGLTGLPTFNGLLFTLLFLFLLPLKSILFFFLLLQFQLRARTAFMVSITLTAYSEFALIVGTATVSAGLLSQEWVVIFALLTAVSYALNAPISRAANNLWAKYEPFLIRFEKNTPHPDTDPPTFGSATHLIVGMGRAGATAYDTILAEGKRPLGLDVDPARIERHLSQGRRVIFGDAQDPMLWQDIHLDGLEAIILTLPNMEAKIRSAQVLREEGFLRPINALIRQNVDEERLRGAGVTAVSLPIAEAGRELALVSLQSEAS